MTRPNDEVDVPASTFNEVGQLWNDNDARIVAPKRYLTAIDETVVLPGIQNGKARPTVLRDFAAVPSDLPSERKSNIEVDVQRLPIVGSFAAVRAARILHQYQIAFWTDSGVIDSTVVSSAADPSSADISAMYAQFLAFNYLPASMTPTIDEFTTLVSPSKRPQNVKNALPNMGIVVTPTPPVDPTFFAATPSAPVAIPGNIPFASGSLSSFCNAV